MDICRSRDEAEAQQNLALALVDDQRDDDDDDDDRAAEPPRQERRSRAAQDRQKKRQATSTSSGGDPQRPARDVALAPAPTVVVAPQAPAVRQASRTYLIERSSEAYPDG
jgi:hypothetical protein